MRNLNWKFRYLLSKPHTLFITLFLIPVMAFAQELTTVSGTITSSEDKMGIMDVQVSVEGTDYVAFTDENGNYEFEVPDNATLSFTIEGFQQQDIPVNGLSTINVAMAPARDQILEEVIVIGYGTTKKSDLTGSVASVGQDDLTAIPVTNALEALQGKVAGMDMTKSSGQPGAGLNFNIRGNRSLNASNGPLIVVDGMIYGNDVDINPNDIQSLEVLKDASATAIYGTLGANGVILITTKRGKKGKSKISYNTYYSVNDVGRYADIMTGPEFVQLRREARRTVGEWNGPEDDVNIFTPVQLENFNNGIWSNWAEEVMELGSQQNHQLSIAGGSDKTNYYFSMEYFKEDGILANDDLNRYSGRLALDHQITDKLKLSTVLNYIIKDQDLRRDPLNQANKISPLGPAYDEFGEVVLLPIGDQNISPLADNNRKNYVNNDRTDRFFGTVSALWTPFKNFNFTSRLGIDRTNSRIGMFSGQNTIEVGVDGLSIARVDNELFNRTTFENFINYDFKLGSSHEFQTMVGTSIWKTRQEDYFAQGRNLASITMLYNNLGAAQEQIAIGSNLMEQQMASFFGRVNYIFKEKYLLTGVVRADGSSVLSEGNKWGFFPSIAGSWIVSREEFLKENSTVNNLKLRASYGISGNSAVSPYQTKGVLGRSTYAFNQGSAENAAFGFYPALVSTPGLTWETTATLNFGLDFGFFNNRISGSVDVYQQDTKDLLMQRAIPGTSGFTLAWDNIGKTRNQGIEVLLSTDFVRQNEKKGFGWSTDFTFTANKEEIVDLPSGDRDLANLWFVGSPISVFYDYEKLGIWQLGQEAEAAQYGQEPGDIRVKDQNGDGVITVEDRIILGNNVPDYTLGINNRFKYKGFELSAFIFIRQGQMISSEAAGAYKINGLENGADVDYWTPENATNNYPRPDAGTNPTSAQYFSTLRYVDGSFIKIRDITLAYDFPSKFVDRMGISKLRLYATAKNYFVFSEIEPYDPERGGLLSFPMTRQLLMGLNIEL
ncbi:SusC/RagA family TonB-linked outer membrane protein [Moheibacter sediminis]|uniref:TonB-linked outer membrane protein, SusC/RagA family n=1 Tax=Moheibacter sediminis TaxID=1434700 RepID=A0A1W2CY29_9FLAO|nr:TonB-dependent receptor [Moheibacter sediminis]SMC90070.1 TonB-linked outer membrane protein, SusC/RagA family [Moheibacter sediminis]